MARGLIGVGNFELLPEFRTRQDVGTGEDLLRKIGSAPSYDQIIGKYKQERDLTRHAGAGRRRNQDIILEGQILDINEVEFSDQNELVPEMFDLPVPTEDASTELVLPDSATLKV